VDEVRQRGAGRRDGQQPDGQHPGLLKEKLLIDADINGPGKAVGPYFEETPLKESLAATLQQLQLDGDVNARLHLDIPLDGEMTTAKGDVRLKNNSLYQTP
jgi:uncharacterized protein YhdP